MKIHALLIGINHYHPDSGVTSLSGCHKDVQNMKAFLENEQWFSKAGLQIKTLLDGEATYQNIINHFGNDYLLKAEKGDTVLIQYSGHGAREKAAPEFAAYFPEEKQETIVCYDSRLPGRYDLADKELAVLVERIAAKGAEIVLLLDCCHSGSGTRDTAAFQLGKARQWDDRDTARPLESYLEGHFTKKIYIPASRHILLAACEKREKAYELLSNQGSFTTHLIEVLEQSKGNISYADLFAQTRSLMRKITDRQTPQFETSGFFNAQGGFLGQGTGSNQPAYLVYEGEGVWKVEAGAIQGMPTMPDQRAAFHIYENGGLVAHAETRKVSLNHSVLFSTYRFKKDSDINYQARLISIPVPPVAVAYTADEAGEAALVKVMERYRPIYFELVEAISAPFFKLQIVEGSIKLYRTADGLLIRTLNDISDIAFKDIFKNLEILCRWKKTLALENREQEGRLNLELVLLLLDDKRNVVAELSGQEAIIDILKQDGREQQVPFRIEARNHSGKAWHCALFYFSANYGIYKMYNEEVPANTSVVMVEYNSQGESYAFELNGKDKATDIFKLIGSSARINDYLLTQPGIKIGERISQPRSIGIKEEATFEQETFDDWFTVTMRCEVVARH